MACNHGECHHENGKQEEVEERKPKKTKMILYIISIFLFVIGLIPGLASYRLLIYLLCAILAGYDLILGGIKNIFKFNFEEDTLMTIAVIAAFALGDFPESCMVILLFKLGEFLEDKAVEMSQANIKDIVKIKANTANRYQDGESKVVEVETLKVGDHILIKPGEKVPVDAMILEGSSELDASPITGESRPEAVEANMPILSGSINLTGALICEVTKEFKDSMASQIVDLVYEASNNKGRTERFITRFSKVYTPTVIVIAILMAAAIAIFPNFLGHDFKRALLFLVASCPCSLVIAVPLSFFSCIGAISKKGMIIKGTKHIEALAKADTICFDKTGTITTGKMVVEKMEAMDEYEKEKVEKYMVALEKLSNHPISSAIQQYGKENQIEDVKVEDYEEIPGYGIFGKIEGSEVLLGNIKLMDQYGVAKKEEVNGAIYLAVDKKMVGYVTLKEEVRADAKKAIEELKKSKVKQTIMLTGDGQKQAIQIAEKVGMDQTYAELLPQEKLEKVKQLKEKGDTVIFIGDGINDSPVLATSNFGISMGTGSEIAGNSADGILISNQLSSLPKMIQIARKSMSIIRFNILFSLVIKLIVLTLGILGYAPIWLAILADTGVTFLTVLNSLRIFKNKEER